MTMTGNRNLIKGNKRNAEGKQQQQKHKQNQTKKDNERSMTLKLHGNERRNTVFSIAHDKPNLF